MIDPPTGKSWGERFSDELFSTHTEVTLRLGFAMFLGFVFTFANIYAITPIEMNLLMAVLIPGAVLMLPTLMFSFGSVLLPLFSAFVYCYCSTSALLAIAVAAGTEWFILCFALWTFWNSFMRWDKLEGGKVGIIIVTVIFQTTIIWPTYDTVQNGFTVPDPSISPLTAQVLKGFLSDAVGEAMMKGEGTHDVLITTSDLADDGEFLKNVMEQHLIAAKALDTCAKSLKKDDLALLESIPTVLNDDGEFLKNVMEQHLIMAVNQQQEWKFQ
eukprot:g13013.t1 g13013   contig7:673752-675650(+)